jgi:hypothetical protein
MKVLIIIKLSFPAVQQIILILFASLSLSVLFAQDAREIVRKSVELDQANWLVRMKDYIWNTQETERYLDSSGRVKSQDSKAWETAIFYGEAHRRMLERNGQPLSAEEHVKQQRELDRVVAKLERETPEQRQRRQAESAKQLQKEREFLSEVSDLYNFHLDGEETIEGRDVWVISALPKLDYQPRRRDAKPLLKIRGRLWVDKTKYQWVRVEAETTGTISYGLFLARLNPGAKLFFEQTRINDEVWMLKREMASGSGRLGLVKKIRLEQETIWSNYRKFQAESKIVSVGN